ncbi:MAG: serine/threonine protein kinase [Planctomycetota bacterium]|jgi:serine/threonine protein kinase
MVGGPIVGILLFLLAVTFFGLAVAFILVPLFKGIGWLIGGVFKGIGWLIRHVFEFISGMLKDTVRFVGAVIAWIVMLPLAMFNVVIGRWSASGHFWRSMTRECKVGTMCLYRVVLQRPLKFLLLHGLLEGVEDRVGEAMVAAPTSDKPSRRAGKFEGYEIIGSLPGGGSGAKLYIARPDASRRAANDAMPDRVVIKSFMISDGSTLPQIVRESRALEAAKQLGLVLDHGMDEHRFFYVMPYHEGDHLGIITRQLHGESADNGLQARQLGVAFGYVADLVQTLARYHRGGLWHKDVKPDNVIVHDGRAHLVDLGLVTPLRSAMTLTTHGTEYFRDPEMVRMALRGVKVHQVDGAKFDIYAAGAVLYFVLENTFPAHGGLSAFAKRSPESARWIVRRAMADYHKRYESAEMLLADLEYVRRARDPFAVKPAELPSMGGEAPADLLEEPIEVDASPQVVAFARTPEPSSAEPKPEEAEEVSVKGFGVSIGSEGVRVGSRGIRGRGPRGREPGGEP